MFCGGLASNVKIAGFRSSPANLKLYFGLDYQEKLQNTYNVSKYHMQNLLFYDAKFSISNYTMRKVKV